MKKGTKKTLIWLVAIVGGLIGIYFLYKKFVDEKNGNGKVEKFVKNITDTAKEIFGTVLPALSAVIPGIAVPAPMPVAAGAAPMPVAATPAPAPAATGIGAASVLGLTAVPAARAFGTLPFVAPAAVPFVAGAEIPITIEEMTGVGVGGGGATAGGLGMSSSLGATVLGTAAFVAPATIAYGLANVLDKIFPKHKKTYKELKAIEENKIFTAQAVSAGAQTTKGLFDPGD